jgi:hypothetical protein
MQVPERSGFEGEVEGTARAAQCAQAGLERLGLGDKADRGLGPPVMIHTPEHAALTVQIQGGIKRSFLFHIDLIAAGGLA